MQYSVFSNQMIAILETALASAFRGTNFREVAEQIKQRYACLGYDFMGA
jgi:hypothetical protein